MGLKCKIMEMLFLLHFLDAGQTSASSPPILTSSVVCVKLCDGHCGFYVNTVAGMNKMPRRGVFLLHSRRRMRIKVRWREMETESIDSPLMYSTKNTSGDQADRKEKDRWM